MSNELRTYLVPRTSNLKPQTSNLVPRTSNLVREGGEMVSALLLGIDIGTSSSKGVLARPDGTVAAVATRPHELSLPRPGWAEHDAETIWWADFAAICATLLPQASDPIAAVCISGI